MSQPHQSHFSDWAKPFANSVKGRISYIEGDVVHLFHGDVGARHYPERRVGFEKFQFDPQQDLAFTQDGAWRWQNDKLGMQAYVREQLWRLLPSAIV